MAGNNDQVKYTDLFDSDITSGLNALKTALEEVVKQIAALKAEAQALKKALGNANTATREQQQTTAADAAEAERLSRQIKELTTEEARLKAAIAEANRMTKLQGQAANAAEGSLNQMRARYKLLVAEMSNYNLKTEEGRRKMQSTAAQARKLRDEIYKLEASYGQFGRNVGNYTGALSRFGARLKEAAARFVAFNAAFLSATGLIRFGKALFEVRKELESTLVTYKALAGEIQGAKLFEEVKNFALTTPVTLNAASKAVQTMLSFGVAQEKVVDIMKRLGDISSADSERMQRLALAYSQATQAGRLMGQDTLQFINAGFNPLYYISLRTGESMEYLRDQMKKGKIDISQVTQAIIDATSEGGQFNGMLEKQRDTMKGAAAIMEGAWQNMLNEMGSDMESGIVGIIKWLTKLMQSWRETMRTLRNVGISLAAGKAAMITYKVVVEAITKAKAGEVVAFELSRKAKDADTAATVGMTKAQIAATIATNALKTAVNGLWKVLKANWIFLAISALTWLGTKLYDTATAAKRAAKEMKDFEDAAAQGVSGTISQYQQLAREWKSLEGNQNERANWIKEHKRLFDELGVSINNANEADRAFSEEGTDAYIRAVRRRAIADAYKDKLAQMAVKKQEMEDNGTAYSWVATTPIVSTKVQADTAADGRVWLRSGETTQVGESTIKQKSAEYLKLEQDIALIEQKIRDFENGALEGTLGRGYSPVTTGGSNDNKNKRRASGSFNNSYRGVMMEDVLVEEANAMRDKGGDVLAEIQLWYDKKVAIANAAYDKEIATLNKEKEQRSQSLEQNLNNARVFQSRYAKLVAEVDKDPTLDEEGKAARKAELERQLNEATALIADAENQRQNIADYYAAKAIAARQKRDNELADLEEQRTEKLFKEEQKRFNAYQDAEKRRFELEKHNSIERAKFDMEQEIASKQWQIDHAKELELSEAELAILKEEVEWLNKKYNSGNYNAKRGNTGNYSNIMDVLFGEKITNDQISALNSVFDQAKEALNSWMDARKAAADQAKELADDEVSAAENALNREIELRNQGYANDVALREKELADAKAAQKRAVEEQKKIAGEQILLDAALQTSSLITASANIWKQFGTQPLLAIAMLGTMWGSFLYSKAKAYQVSQKSVQFKEGGVMLLEGGSHESGHDVNLGIGPDGSNLRAEGGEYFAVINKRSSRKYGSQIPAVVNALNSGMFEDRYIKTSDAVGLLPQVIRADNGTAVDLSSLEGGVDALVKQGESRWSVEGEYRVMRYKNLTRRVRVS